MAVKNKSRLKRSRQTHKGIPISRLKKQAKTKKERLKSRFVQNMQKGKKRK